MALHLHSCAAGSWALFTARRVSRLSSFVCRLQTLIGGSAPAQNRTGTSSVPRTYANHYHHEGICGCAPFALPEATRPNGFRRAQRAFLPIPAERILLACRMGESNSHTTITKRMYYHYTNSADGQFYWAFLVPPVSPGRSISSRVVRVPE